MPRHPHRLALDVRVSEDNRADSKLRVPGTLPGDIATNIAASMIEATNQFLDMQRLPYRVRPYCNETGQILQIKRLP